MTREFLLKLIQTQPKTQTGRVGEALLLAAEKTKRGEAR